MKYRKTLLIAGQEYHIVTDELCLELSACGRAVFQVNSSKQLSGKVQYILGASNQTKDRLYFTGYIESSHRVDDAQQRIFCRELAGIFFEHTPISLKHPTLENVLSEYRTKTKVVFITPDQKYSKIRIPCFQTFGNVLHGLDSIGAAFSIQRYIWASQPDGSVFVGSWDDSRAASRPLDIPEDNFTRVFTNGSKTCAIIPGIRPGLLINNKLVKQVRIRNHEMEVTCAP